MNQESQKKCCKKHNALGCSLMSLMSQLCCNKCPSFREAPEPQKDWETIKHIVSRVYGLEVEKSGLKQSYKIYEDTCRELQELLSTQFQKGYEAGRKSKPYQQQVWQEKMRERGKCRVCGKEQSKTSKNYCEKHRLSHNEYQRKRREKLKAKLKL